MGFDSAFFSLLFSFARKSSWLDVTGILFAQALPYGLLAAFAVYLVMQRSWKARMHDALFSVLAVILSRGIFTEILRVFLPRERPFLALSLDPLITRVNASSFPSGHAAFFFALAGAVWLCNWRWGAWFFGAATLMGLARVFVGVHWPSDIVAGAIVGAASVVLARFLLRASFPSRT